MKPEKYLDHYGIKLPISTKKLVLLAMENYRNQTQLLIQVDSIFDTFISEWNKVNISQSLKGRIRVLDKKTMTQIRILLDKGYSISDMMEAYKNSLKDEYHISTSYRYLTPEFITRIGKFNRFYNETYKHNITESKTENDGGFKIIRY
jgi:hypothetical protein